MKTRNARLTGVAVIGWMSGSVLAGGVELQPRMGDPIPGMTSEQMTAFLAGQNDYNTPFLAEEGLGPIFNKESCGNCHNNPLGGTGSQTVTRAGFADKGGFDALEMFGGPLFQQQAIDEDCAEVVHASANVMTLRVTNGMLGYGLVEAIEDADILALESSPPGVSGKARMTEAFEAPGVPRVGRFGWKAQLPTLLSFSADAALMEIGITNRFLMTENDPNGINPPSIAECDTVADPEDGPDENGDHFIDRVTVFQQFLAQPPQTPKNGMTGETIFNTIGCADCHHPSFVTSNDPSVPDPLRNQAIRPYSDFLLHDMGLAADFIPDGAATDREIRTPPLWGVRVRDPLWHDGRFGGDTFANRVTLAIEEHGVFGSEAIDSADNFDSLSGAEKNALIAFLDSLGRIEFDGDGDGVIDIIDFLSFADCMGNGPYTADDPCAVHDLDQDGDVDLDDFDGFLLAYDGDLEDCNNNGTPDFVDILTGASPDLNGDGQADDCCPGDFDNSGAVDFNDIVSLLAAWGTCVDCPYDLDGNDDVGFNDLLAVLSAYGPCP